MKKIQFAALLLALLCVLNAPFSTAHAQGTAFSYQGLLTTGNGPANGTYDLTFTLFNTNATGSAVSATVTNTAASVSNGLFTVAVDFGSAPFKLGQPLWLEIGARTNGAAAFSTLAPRQAVLSTPIATYAESANATNLTGTIVSANLPNGLGGSGDSASGLNATVSGGSGNQVDAASSYSTIGAGNANSIANTLYATIGGGNQNVMNNTAGFGTIGGGNGNFIANTLDGTIAGGFHNTITNGATFAAVGGGNGNAIGGGFDSVIGGGFQNFVNASFATVPGGANNSAVANYSFAAGDQAQAVNAGAFVWADSQGVNFSSTNNNSFNVRAQGGARFVTSGAGLTVDGPVTATSFAGNGSGLTALNAASLTTGTVADGLLSANVALRNATNNFTAGQNTFTGNVGIGLSVPPGAPLDVFGTMRVANSAGQFSYVGFPAGSSQTAILGQFLTSDTNYPQLRFSRLMGGNLMDIGQDGNGNFGVFGNTVERLTVQAAGNVGIGTTTPAYPLDVNGSSHVSGTIRMGSETGTSQAPTITGIVVRRINSTSSATNQIVARTDLMTLERDGTAGGFLVRFQSNNDNPVVAGTAIDQNGNATNVFKVYFASHVLVDQIFTEAQNVGYFRLSFGDPYTSDHMTEVVLTRFVGGGNDTANWVGTVTSTYNQ